MTQLSQPPSAEPLPEAALPPLACPWPWWVTAMVVLGALLTATGGVLALFALGEHLNTAGQNYAEYFITRNLAVAALLLLMLALRARRPLAALMVLTACIH